MKNLKVFLLSLCCLVSVSVFAKNPSTLSMTVSASVQKDVWDVFVQLENPSNDNYTAFQMDMTMPEGFKYVENSLKPSVRIMSHNCSAQLLQNGKLRLLAFSGTNAKIWGKTGELLHFSISVVDESVKGEHTMQATDISFIDREGKEEQFADISSSFLIATLYTIVYQVDNTEFARQQIKEGEDIPPLDSVPTKEGHTFTGWENLPDTMPGNDLLVTAKFQVNTYTITYVLNGKEYAKQQVEYGKSIIPPKVDENESVAFEGWQNLPETMPAHDLTIYGKTRLTGIENVTVTGIVDVYDLFGRRVLTAVTLGQARQILHAGVYVVNGKKVLLN